MILSNEKSSVSWRLNDLLAADKKAKDFAAVSWTNQSSSTGEAVFRRWEPQEINPVVTAEEIEAPGESDKTLEKTVDKTVEDEPDPMVVSMAVFNQAKQGSFEDGHARGFEEAELKWKSARDSFLEITQSIYQEQQKATTFFEPLKTLSLHLAQQLVRGELSISSDAIERLIRGVLEEVQEKGPSSIVITLNPDDLGKVRSNLAEDLAYLDLRPNDSLSQGSVVLSVNSGAIEDLIEHRLEALSESLFAEVPADD